MKSARKILVTLHQPELFRRSRRVRVTASKGGELPARLIDPIDRKGRVIPGEWAAGTDEDGSAVYRWAGSAVLATA